MELKEKGIKKSKVETPEKNFCNYAPVKYETCPACNYSIQTGDKICFVCGYCLVCN